MMKKIIYCFTILFYLIGMVTGLILVDFNLVVFLTDFSIEKLLFSSFNIFVIVYIIYLCIDFYLQIEKATKLYEFSEDLSLLIGTMLIKPTGYIVSIMIPLILLLASMNYFGEEN